MGNTPCINHNKQLGLIDDSLVKILIERQNNLASKIKTYLQKQKPYEKQLSEKQITLKKIGNHLYHGQTNFFGQPHGIGKLYRYDGSLFVGKFYKSQADGMGYWIFPNGNIYEGNFVKDKINDPKGKLVYQQTVYLGSYKNDNHNGQGQFDSEHIHFKGQFIKGKISQGTLYWKNSTKNTENYYTGKFDQKQKFTGNGILKTAEGTYQGEFQDGLKNGKGKFTHKTGWKYEGFYVNGQKSGWGTLYDQKNKIKYEGRWESNIPHGVGKQFDIKGNILEDQFILGLPSSYLLKA